MVEFGTTRAEGSEQHTQKDNWLVEIQNIEKVYQKPSEEEEKRQNIKRRGRKGYTVLSKTKQCNLLTDFATDK